MMTTSQRRRAHTHGGGVENLVGREASLLHHQHLPVEADALLLAMGARLHETAGVVDGSDRLRGGEVVVVPRSLRLLPAQRASHDRSIGHELHESRVLPHVRRLIPVLLCVCRVFVAWGVTFSPSLLHHNGSGNAAYLAPQATIVDDEGGRPRCARLSKERYLREDGRPTKAC
jgi:hypothetical protein